MPAHFGENMEQLWSFDYATMAFPFITLEFAMTPQKTILITGCSSGIGLCAARGLRERGYRVFPTARKPEDVEKLRAEGFESFCLDLTDSVSIQTTVEQVLAATGGELYALVNNGAYAQPGAVEDLSRDMLREQFETNLFGTHELTCQVLPVMRRQGYGRIVQISSMLGFVALPFRGAYNASKYAMEGLSDTLRLELAGSGVYVSLIQPGPILTQFRDNASTKYLENIDSSHSVHHKTYRIMEEGLLKPGPPVPFTLGPDAVLKQIIRALEAPRPKAHYCVTVPAYVFAVLKRILPTQALDWLLKRAG